MLQTLAGAAGVNEFRHEGSLASCSTDAGCGPKPRRAVIDRRSLIGTGVDRDAEEFAYPAEFAAPRSPSTSRHYRAPMGDDVNELKAVTWAGLGPVPAALIVGFSTHLWVVSWGLQLAGSLGYLFGARGRAKRRVLAPEPLEPATGQRR